MVLELRRSLARVDLTRDQRAQMVSALSGEAEVVALTMEEKRPKETGHMPPSIGQCPLSAGLRLCPPCCHLT